MNATIILDNHMAKLAKKFSLHYNAPAIDVYKISGNVNLPKTQSVILCNYLAKKEPESKECDVFNMLVDLDLTK